jgi:hypothetical protein
LFEDSLKAYYASEAGVEAALLEWRFNHDVELWNKDKAKVCAERVVTGGDTSICDELILSRAVSLDSQSIAGKPVQDITDQIFDENGKMKTGDDLQAPANQSWYEMRMYFRDPYQPTRGDVADPANVNENPIRINKDETYEVRFPDEDAYRIYMEWKPTYDWIPGTDDIKLLWEPVVEDMNGDYIIYDDPARFVNPELPSAIKERQYFSDNYIEQNEKQFNINTSRFGSGMKILRVTVQIKTNGNDYDVNGEKKGVYLFLRAIDNNSNMIHIPDNQVTIEVVGHYNNISRSVEYTLDRQSGTIMNIFDYGVYSKEDFVK